MDRECKTMTETRVLAARAGLTDRVAALERRVTGTVEEATDTVHDAAAAVKSTVATASSEVQRAFGATADSVRSALDVPTHIRRHPWAGIGAAGVAGFLAGFIPNNSRRITVPSSPSVPGLMSNLWAVIRRELMTLGESAIVSASQAAKEGISSRLALHHSHNGKHL
jgi:ElaB/YqjD/DUF883 family membrane-anchored ribosome-binding protein